MTEIKAPTHCPCCDSVLTIINNILFCKNRSCGEQAQKKVEHFSKTLKIKGLGPKAIEKLGLQTPQDIYRLSFKEISTALNSDVIARKLIDEIEKSKRASLNTVIPAMSIPLVGKTASNKLAAVCNTIEDIDEETCDQAGLGPKTTESLMTFFENNWEEFTSLPFSFQFSKPQQSTNAAAVCISGKLKSFKTKAEASDALAQKGYVVKSTLTKDVTILINESGLESAKTKQARERGIQVVTSISNLLGDR